MKHLLILLSFLLILSSPLFGQSGKPQTIIIPTGSLGEMSEARIKILEKTLESKIADHFAIVPKELFEEAQEQAFQEMDSDECTEDQCILMIKEILQIENAFKMDLISEDGDTQISITWNDQDQKRVVEDYCEGCKTKGLRLMIGGLVEKLIGVKDVVKEEPPKKVQTIKINEIQETSTIYKNNNCEIVCDSLVAYFSFNGNTKDVTGNNNEGKIVGAKLTKDKHGKINNAYMFNGKNYIKLETNNLYNNDNSFSISIISNTIRFSDKYKYSSRAGSSYTSQELLINSNRTVHLELFYFSDGGRNIGFYVGEKTVWGGLTRINDYHHIVVIADGLNKEIKIYLDGKIKETKKWSNTSVSGKNGWILGGDFGERGYIGVIDEIRFYDKALTTEEVRNIYINYF